MRRILATAILAATALAASAQDTRTFEWKGEVQSGQTLEIRNINGGIRAEPASGSEAEVTVRITGTRPRPESIRIDVVPHDGGVLLCTVYEGLSNPDRCTVDETPSVSLHSSDIRVKYTVRVPAGVRLLARTVNGRVLADLPDSPISAFSVNGRIDLSTNQAADAHTVNGSIVAELGAVEGTSNREFRTVNGSVDVQIPEFADVTVDAGLVFGWMTTEFSVPIHRWFIGSTMKGDINRGGAGLRLSTVNGSIHLRKEPAE